MGKNYLDLQNNYTTDLKGKTGRHLWFSWSKL